MPGPDEFSVGQRLANPAAVLPVTGAGTGAPGPTGPPPPTTFSGTACKMGDMVACMCTDGVSSGVQICRADMLSPTKGALSACERCMAPAPVQPPAAGMAGGDVGAAGASGSNGSASGGTGGMSTGSGGMSAGSGGMSAGSGGSAGSMPMCDPDDCPGTTGLFGIEREPCCTRRGECGGINGLSGDCETD